MLSKFFKKGVNSINHISKRFFDLHEYQSKDIMRKFNVRVQKGEIALDAATAGKVAEKLDPAGGLILKAQIHAGGRGKGKKNLLPQIALNVIFFLPPCRYPQQWIEGWCQNLQNSQGS